jgi:ATPase family associated with various cellular activities (AAA)
MARHDPQAPALDALDVFSPLRLPGSSIHNSLGRLGKLKMKENFKIATEVDWTRSAVERHRPWIESTLGIGLDQAAIVEITNDLPDLAIVDAFPALRHTWADDRSSLRLAAGVTTIEYLSKDLLLLRGRIVPRAGSPVTNRQAHWDVEWGDMPFAIRTDRMRGALVVLRVPYFERDTTLWNDFVIFRRDEADIALDLVAAAERRRGGSFLFEGNRDKHAIRPLSWDDLVLDPTITRMIREDFEGFFAREDWFRHLNIPFRRGYLLYGPPGNGKTSVIKTMLSRPGMRGYTMNFFSMNVDDDDLQHLFERAAAAAPSIVIMEDLDRSFPKNQAAASRSRVSLQRLLNCLDGVGTQDGVLVVATANHPAALDPAILRRPGRFDRVVLFPDPDEDLRLRYLRKLNCPVPDSELHPIVERTRGFSFARLREVYILAGQSAFERGGTLELADLSKAIEILQDGYTRLSQSDVNCGFPRSASPLMDFRLGHHR